MPTFAELYDKAKRAWEDGSSEHALVPATEAVKLEPENVDARLLLARVWLAQRGWARAIAEAKLVLSRVPVESAAATAAHEVLAAGGLGLPDPAIAESSLALLAKEPSNLSAMVRLIAFLLANGRIDDARARAEELAARRGPEAAEAEALAATLDARPEGNADLLALADLEMAASLGPEARAHYQQVLSREPTNERAANGFRSATGQPRSAAPAAQGSSSRALAFLPTTMLSLGGAMLLFARFRANALEAMRPDLPRLFLAVGGGTVAGAVVLEVWLRLSRRRSAEKAS
jgi:hypothetical protein